MPRVIDEAEISNYFFFKIKEIITKIWAEAQCPIETLAFEPINRGPPPSFWGELNIQHPTGSRAQTVDNIQLPRNKDQSQLAQHLPQPQIEVYFRVLHPVHRLRSSNIPSHQLIWSTTFNTAEFRCSNYKQYPATKREGSKLVSFRNYNQPLADQNQEQSSEFFN